MKSIRLWQSKGKTIHAGWRDRKKSVFKLCQPNNRIDRNMIGDSTEERGPIFCKICRKILRDKYWPSRAEAGNE